MLNTSSSSSDVGREIYVDPLNEEHGHNLPFWRDNEKLWALDVPTEDMQIDELLWILEMPFWENERGDVVITPREVLRNSNDHPSHHDRIHGSDTSFAIDIMKNKHDMWCTLDGLHRLVKLVIMGETKVRVRKIPPELIHLTARDA